MSKNSASSCIYIDSLDGKKLFLDFWKIPYLSDSGSKAPVSIITGDGLHTHSNNSIVLLPGDGEAQLYHLDNGIHIFAKVRRINRYPDDLTVLTPVFDIGKNTISYILKDRKKETVYLPFSLDDVFEGFYYERYTNGKGKTFLPKPVMNLYYLLKPFVPTAFKVQARIGLAKLQGKRKFPRWPLERSLEDFKRFILELLLGVSKSKELPFLWFWPEEKGACLLLTHDVESGLNSNSGIHRIISTEHKHGFRSVFNIVPFKYELDENTMNEIESRGCEIGVHGYSHDAKLFSSYEVFKERIPAVNTIARKWGASGFRSCATYRNSDWFSLMDFDYDCSFFDTDPYEPQPGGCLSLFPYFIGKLVEIPTTLPQDHTLFMLLEQEDIEIWKKKTQEIREYNGLISLIAHPDDGYIGDEENEKHYSELLDFFANDNNLWNPLPRDAAIWWRKRHKAEILINDGQMEIKEATSGMTIRWAQLVNGTLQLQENTQSKV